MSLRFPDEVNDAMKYTIWGFIIGMVTMYVLLIYVLKDAQYYHGVSDGMFKLARQLIVDLAKK